MAVLGRRYAGPCELKLKLLEQYHQHVGGLVKISGHFGGSREQGLIKVFGMPRNRLSELLQPFHANIG